MKKSILSIIVVFCSYLVSAQMGTDNFQKLSDSEVSQVEKQYSYENLRLYPIRAKKNYHQAYKNIKDFVSLEQALKKGWLEITEVSSSGRVNTLLVKNKSKYTIYGIAGEVVMGGKQDRILGDDVIIKPFEEKTVSSFCVEHGRWSQKESGNKFTGYFNVSSNSVRKAAIVEKDQGKVWKNVDEIIVEQKSENSTQAYTSLKDNKTYNATKTEYLNHFKDLWKDDKDVIGVVVVSGDKVIGCDIFATHQLFSNSFNNLLHAYISEALTNGAKVSISYTEVQAYLQGFLGATNPKTEKLKQKGKVYEFENIKLHLSSF